MVPRRAQCACGAARNAARYAKSRHAVSPRGFIPHTSAAETRAHAVVRLEWPLTRARVCVC